jgi:hypothetical protein
VIAALAILAVAGCATKTVAPPPDVPPAANSAPGAVERFEWAINHRDPDVVEGMLTDDFQFISAGTDSAGNPSRDTLGGRSWLDVALRALLDPANQVSLLFDANLIPFPDSRPGKDPKWHRQVRSSIDLRVHDAQANTTFEVSGYALFFLTRGDSAQIPPELLARGVKPDSTVWWFDRCDDETLGGAGARAPASPAATNPSFVPTLANLLRYYYSRSMK